jgi:hypothetical protein
MASASTLVADHADGRGVAGLIRMTHRASLCNSNITAGAASIQ